MRRGLLKATVVSCLVLAGAIAAVGLLAPSPTRPADPDVVGRWCDTPAGQIVIRRTAKGLVAATDIAKGRPPWKQIVDRDGDVFRARRSPHGDGFRILAGGDLQVFDDQGPIRVAHKASGPCKPW